MTKSSSSWRGRRESDSQVFCHTNSVHASAGKDKLTRRVSSSAPPPPPQPFWLKSGPSAGGSRLGPLFLSAVFKAKLLPRVLVRFLLAIDLTKFGGMSVARSLQNMSEGTAFFDLAPSQDQAKDVFRSSMVLVSCLVLMSVLPGIVVVVSKVDVLPSVRRSVMTSAAFLVDIGLFCGLCSYDCCRDALHHCLLLFVFTRYLVWFGCFFRLLPGPSEEK